MKRMIRGQGERARDNATDRMSASSCSDQRSDSIRMLSRLLK